MKKLTKLNQFRLTHLEMGQLLQRNLDDLVTAGVNVATDSHIQSYVQQLTADKASFDQAIIQIRKQEETEQLVHLDQLRDNAFTTLKRKIQLYQYSDVQAESDAYHALTTLLQSYKNLPKLNYEAESNAITNLALDVASARFATHASTLNLQPFITKLTTANTDFNTLFSQRSTDVAATVVYDTKALRQSLTEHYKSYATYVLAMANTLNTPYYNGLLDIINTIRSYFSDVLARRTSGRNPS